MSDKTKFALTFLGGAAVGVGIGLLFAPRPGKETRAQVKKWIEDKTEKGKELWAKGKEQLAQQKEQLGAALDAGKKAYYEAGGIKVATTNAHKEPRRVPAGV